MTKKIPIWCEFICRTCVHTEATFRYTSIPNRKIQMNNFSFNEIKHLFFENFPEQENNYFPLVNFEIYFYKENSTMTHNNMVSLIRKLPEENKFEVIFTNHSRLRDIMEPVIINGDEFCEWSVYSKLKVI